MRSMPTRHVSSAAYCILVNLPIVFVFSMSLHHHYYMSITSIIYKQTPLFHCTRARQRLHHLSFHRLSYVVPSICTQRWPQPVREACDHNPLSPLNILLQVTQGTHPHTRSTIVVDCDMSCVVDVARCSCGRGRVVSAGVVGDVRDVSVGTQRCIGRHCRRPLVSA